MKKTIEFIKNNNWLHYGIIIIIGIIISIPLLNIQIRDTHDGCLHFLRMLGTVNCFKIGEIPPIVAPYYCNDGGYAMNLFYNPLVTYVPLLIKLFTSSYLTALKIFAGLCIILSGITMYQFVYSVTKKRIIALFSAIFYILAPYKLGDVYRRYAIGEFASFIFMPILFKGIYNLFNEDGKKHYFIALGAIGLLLTHTVTTFYMAIFSAVYVLFNIKKLKDLTIIKKICINVLFILLVTLFFTAPMYEAKKTTEYAIFNDSIMSTNGVYASEHALELNQLFTHKVETFEDTIYCIGIPIFVLLLLTAFTYRKTDEKYKDFIVLSMFFSIISVFMTTKYCPWILFPNILCKLQYPWRMLGFFNFFSSFIVGVNLYVILKYWLKKDWIKLFVATLLIIITIIYTMPLVYQFKTEDDTQDSKYEQRIMSDMKISHRYINRDYLPRKALRAQRDYLLERDYYVVNVLFGSCDVSEEIKYDLTITAKLNNYEKASILEFPFFYYPGYEITLEKDGKIVKLESIESDYGFVAVQINEDIKEANIKVEYKGTKITYISYVVSLISFVIFVIYIIREEKHDRKVKESKE